MYKKFVFVLCLLLVASLIYGDVCDELVEFNKPSIADRVINRSYPSVFQAWNPLIIEGVETDNYSFDPELDKFTVYHDLVFSTYGTLYAVGSIEHHIRDDTPPYEGLVSHVSGDLEVSKIAFQRRLNQNPNFLFLAEFRFYDLLESFPENEDYFLKSDITGELVKYSWDNQFDKTAYLNLPASHVQDVLIDRIVGIASCGLFDGIMLDNFVSFAETKYGRVNRELISVEKGAEIMEGMIRIFSEARKRIPKDFLIIVNGGVARMENFTEHINGVYIEGGREPDAPYSYTDLIDMENAMLWNEENLRHPQINCLEGFGFIEEAPDSPKNKKWMRVITTLGLTHSDGYVLYNRGGFYIGEAHHDHIWYDFWDADLGTPVGETAVQYENRDGVFIREFSNGWAVYNRSGSEQEISFGSLVSGKSSEIRGVTHTLPDLDGEIYLKVPLDINNDGIINILDLVIVANNFGEEEPDINGDRIVNILDLVLVANNFGE